MKRILAVMLVCILFFSLASMNASAISGENYSFKSQSVEFLDNGDYVITRLYVKEPSNLNSVKAVASSTSGYKTTTYYNAAGTKMWDLTVQGYFSYTYGISASATSSSATVVTYSSNVTFLSKNAWCSGNTAYATGSVRYNASYTTLNVDVSCDKYGYIS